jgi:hypothetical protein
MASFIDIATEITKGFGGGFQGGMRQKTQVHRAPSPVDCPVPPLTSPTARRPAAMPRTLLQQQDRLHGRSNAPLIYHRPLATLPSALPRKRAATTKTTVLPVPLPRHPPRDDVSDRHTAANSLRLSLHHPAIERETSTRLHAIPVGQRGGGFQPRRRSGPWSKEVLEATKKRVACDTPRKATSDEAKDLGAAPANSLRRGESPDQSSPTARPGTRSDQPALRQRARASQSPLHVLQVQMVLQNPISRRPQARLEPC